MHYPNICMIVAAILFALAAFEIPQPPRINLIALGLFFMALSFLL